MAFRKSTGLRNALAGRRASVHAALVANTISFDSASKEIRDSGNGFVTAGFKAGDKVHVKGSGQDGEYTVVSVSAGALTVEEALSNESAGAYIGVMAGRGGSVNDLFREGILVIFSGSQPASADGAETGTELVRVTDAGGAHNSTTGANGLEFEDEPSNGQVAKKASQTWQGTPTNTGTAGWFRFYAREHITGASTTGVRFDGACGTSNAELNLASTAIQSGVPFSIDNFTWTESAQGS